MKPRLGVFRAFVLSVVGFVVFMAGLLAVVGEVHRVFGRLAERRVADRRWTAQLSPPEPRLQADPEADLQAAQKHWTDELQSYAWVDRARGTARIPIGRAMQLMLRRGFPARGARR